MSYVQDKAMRFAVVVLACVSSLALAATPPAVGIPDGKDFLASVQSNALEAESYDFESAGFFRLSPAERTQWQMSFFAAIAPAMQPGYPQCTVVSQRTGAALAWAQIAIQSTDAEDWKATVNILRSRLAELDHLLERSAPAKPSADPLIQELMHRFARDQDVRHIFSQSKWTEGMSPATANNWMLAASTRVTAIDCDNTDWLKRKLARFGWFTIPKHGEEADSAAWHLVQHADREPDFQREMLEKLEALPPGQTNVKRLGYLFDRVARAEGRLQRYGTQGQCKDGRWTPFESEDPANLDQRRASLGMVPIAEHMEIVSREACPHSR